MDIADAFTHDAIELTDTNVGGDEETELRRMINQIYASNELESDINHENIAVLCFVAGRAYQEQAEPEFTVPMSLAVPFMEFLAQRGSHD